MKLENNELCRNLDAYLDDELEAEIAHEFQQHLEKCASCRTRATAYKRLSAELQQALDSTLPEVADLRIRRRLNQEITSDKTAQDILDMEGVAELLQVPISDIVTLLDEIPSFEIAGRLRFRKDRIEEWIHARERSLQWEREEHSRRTEDKIIEFPGGKA